MNTPRVVLQESKKAFRAIFKRNDLEAAMGALSNLKGVGPAMASGSSSEPLKERGQAQTNGKENLCFVKKQLVWPQVVFGVLCTAFAY